MALIREKRLTQVNLSLHVPSRAPFQLEAAAAPRRCQPPPLTSSTTTPASRSSQFRLADFERVAVLGRGNSGTVYKVRHRETCALYALKLQHAGDAAAAEADLLGRVASPYVVRCHAVLALESASGDAALLLELADGGSLDGVMRRHGGAFPEEAVAEVAAQALSALAHLHARRVAHLDVKPANLLATTDGDVKVADLGIARVVAAPFAAAGAGTAAYMSPERFDPEAHGGGCGDPFAADVWGLGVTVLELAVGRYPLLLAGQRPSWAALMCAICFGEQPAALVADGEASLELRGFVAACLRKDYRKRASVAELLAHPFVAGRDVAASRRALRRLVAEASSPPSS
uniref:Protein kinase domain-containing protein n=1 Tax=Leersia perrieri TaxID=77586 RepID=A0A0D9VY70_9ORYZ